MEYISQVSRQYMLYPLHLIWRSMSLLQLITAEQKSYPARLSDMITVVSQLSQSQNTHSVTVDQRHSSAG